MKRRSPEEYEPEPGGLFAEPRPPPSNPMQVWQNILYGPVGRQRREEANAILRADIEAPPPVPLGETFEPERDAARLGKQYRLVEINMAGGAWRTLRELSLLVAAPEASVSARLRDMRRAGWVVERRRRSPGTHEYRASRTP